jgi:hypothetical protein
MGGQWEERDRGLTDDHGPDRWLIKDPAGGDVGDADGAAAISNRSQDDEQLLEKVPIAPGFQYHVQILEKSSEKSKTVTGRSGGNE